MFKLLVLVLALVLELGVLSKAAEAKVLPQAGKSGLKAQAAVRSFGTTIGVFPKLRADRRALIINFTNLQNATAVSCSLVYTQGNGQQEGAGGALNLTGQTSDKVELLFGTCSTGVCRYHTGIKDAKLEVSYTSKTGKKYLKKFKIKV